MFGNPRIETVPIVGARTLRSLATALTMALAALGMTATAAQAGFVLSQTFDDPTVTTVDSFGDSMALAGNSVLIGAVLDNTNGHFVGQAHLFDAATGALLRTFDDPTVTSADRFGWSVALAGNTVLIGALGDDTSGIDVGQAHLFNATTGALLRTFNDPTPTTADWFGYSVAISGNTVLIGAPYDDTNGTDVGQVHLFDATTGALLRTFDDPTMASGDDRFGVSVALAGNTVLIGAPADDTNGTDVGQAYLFDATTGALLQTFDDPTPTTSDRFGHSVAISGNSVLIGAFEDDTNGTDVGQAHLFNATTGALLRTFDDPTVTSQDFFGWSVALAGNAVLIGAPLDDTNGVRVGQAHLFDATTGALIQTFDDPTVTSIDMFGSSVALAGNSLVIGAPGDNTNGFNVGQAHLFTAVPEPGSLPLFATGLLFLFALLRRRRRL